MSPWPAGRPLVSVVTATWQRHDLLLQRCIPSVRCQTYPTVEHVVVSDGPDPVLQSQIPSGVRFAALESHDPTLRWGYHARLFGVGLIRGDLVAWLDDDDAYRPHHLARMVDALTAGDADFAYSRMAIHRLGVPAGLLPWLASECGKNPPSYGQIATSAIVHRRALLDRATWAPFNVDEQPPLSRPLPLDDWDLVSRWLSAGATYAFVDEITVDYYPAGGSLREGVLHGDADALHHTPLAR